MSSEASKKLGRAVRFGIELNEEQKLCVRERRFGTDPKLPVVSKPLAAKASQGLSSGEQFQKGRVSRKREKKKLKRKRRRQLRRAAVAATKAVAAQLTSNRSSAARTPPSMSLSSSRFVTLGLLALVGKVEAVGAESATWGLNAGQWAIPVAMAVVAVIAGGLMRALWSRKPTRDKGQCDCREKWLKYRAEVSELNKEWGEYLQHLDGDIDSNSSDIGRQGANWEREEGEGSARHHRGRGSAGCGSSRRPRRGGHDCAMAGDGGAVLAGGGCDRHALAGRGRSSDA
jgi:hypothetical protein